MYNNYTNNYHENKQMPENIRPDVGSNGNNEYQKLHDKLNYLESKITEMRTNL